MAGSWKHGWIPLTPAAVASKNHGRKPGGGSKLGQKLAGMKKSSAPKAKSAPKSAAPKPSTPAKARPPAGLPARLSDEELRDLGKTPAGRRQLRERQRQIDEAKSRTARDAAAKAGFTGPPKRKKPHRKSALTRGRR